MTSRDGKPGYRRTRPINPSIALRQPTKTMTIHTLTLVASFPNGTHIFFSPKYFYAVHSHHASHPIKGQDEVPYSENIQTLVLARHVREIHDPQSGHQNLRLQAKYHTTQHSSSTPRNSAAMTRCSRVLLFFRATQPGLAEPRLCGATPLSNTER